MLFGRRLPDPRLEIIEAGTLATGELGKATVDFMRRVGINLV
jgi:hypothetical protein